ncbi:Plasmid stabilization system protein ParE [Novosphingobium sp. CF614]|uniref:type II toxin-antitoxin system RelE/ParE family toxin n=1 Tax=Novosphingobium sp. CF614 TaxID=1884364 RepID=UPI0008E7F0F5|nr:type II toxin-antitoxin system RelE/ParE family toxin [Novosphingobium sp. CF614]SFG28049.1 Plasmid stabilization system protein ParE [Novosphingobium sp. CF614]
MKVLWTPEARQDRADIWDYLLSRDGDAAVRIDDLFSETVARLADFPMLDHEGEVLGTRELTPHSSYRLVYESKYPPAEPGALRCEPLKAAGSGR